MTVGDTQTVKKDKDGIPQKPYAPWLNAELEALRVKIAKDLKDRDTAYDNWVCCNFPYQVAALLNAVTLNRNITLS